MNQTNQPNSPLRVSPRLSVFILAAIAILSCSILTGSTGQSTTQPSPPRRDDSAAERLGWKLGAQAWTFRDRTLFEAIDTANALGLKYMQFFPGHALSKDHPSVKVGVDLSPEMQTAVKDKANSAGVTLVSFGVVGFKNNKDECRKTFEFTKSMGLSSIACEPDEDAIDVLMELCEEYQISLSIHNHPKPSHYWNPDTVLKAINGRGARIGACADTGHWSRSGLVPVECLKKLNGRIIDLHFKDIADDKDQPWGTGQGDARGMLEELQRQNFKGVILLEYESGSGKELEENAAKCLAFFDSTARDLTKAADERK